MNNNVSIEKDGLGRPKVVRIVVGNKELGFIKKEGKIHHIATILLDGRPIESSEDIWVPKAQYKKAIRQAAAVFKRYLN